MLDKETKRIVFVLPLFKEGGAEKTVSAIMAGLAQEGYDVHLVILKDKVSLAYPHGVKGYILETSWMKKLPEFLQKKIYSHRLEKLVDIIKPAIVFTSLPRAHKIVSKVLGKEKNVYYIFHNTPSPSLSDKRFSRNVAIHRYRRMYRGKQLITLSAGIKEDLIHTLGIAAKSIDVINNPFDIEAIKTLAEEKVDDLPEGDFLLSVSHFYKRKRHDILIKGYKASGCVYPLVLLGERGEKEKIQKLAEEEGVSDRVLFLGWKGNPYPYIKQAKLVLLTSDEEGMPRAVVEALILHTPVVSTDCPSGPNELLTGELSSYLVPTGDAEALAEAIGRATHAYPEISDGYTKRFDQHNVVGRYMEIIEKHLLECS